ncbi:CHAD domain-containing protein [Nakamurella silvestris]|nr:CHAD domain-containing protein [Nakamurella silvestris]
MGQMGTPATEHLEVELKFEVEAGTVLPGLNDLDGVAEVRVSQSELSATYFDLPGLRLARAGVTLRRRTGGHDAGWHLKLPAGDDARTEYQVELGDSESVVPAELLDHIRVLVRDHAPAPVATIRTSRTEHLLIGPDGTHLVEVADDTVRTQAFQAAGSARLDSWREWEVELVDGPARTVKAVRKALLKAGATTAGRGSKLVHALGGLPAADCPAPDRKGPAGAVLRPYLQEQITELFDRDPQVRRDEPEGIHKMRVATRRLRSALSTFRPLLDGEVTDPIRDELKWLAEILGRARDVQVQTERLHLAVLAEPSDLVLGPVDRRVQLTLTQAYREAFTGVRQALDSTRYFRLLDALDTLSDHPPLSAKAAGRADRVLPDLVAKKWKRLRKAAGVVLADGTDGELHETRKAAKRARYAAEVVGVVFPRARKDAEIGQDLQEILGEHQDSVVSRDHLRELAAQAYGAGENTFTFGLLHARQQAIAEEIEGRFPAIWKKADRRLRR